MATRDEWIALADRCKAATGPDREIDADIARAIGWVRGYVGMEPCWYEAGEVRVLPYRWTKSLDAITDLIKECFPAGVYIESGKGERRARCSLQPDAPFAFASARAATEALARCVAFCLVMAEMEDGK